MRPGTEIVTRLNTALTERRADLGQPAPAAPSWRHVLGTDNQARDVFALTLYGFRLSVPFGLLLTLPFSHLVLAAAYLDLRNQPSPEEDFLYRPVRERTERSSSEDIVADP